MGTRSRQEYFLILRQRYREAASKSERTRILDEAVENTGIHRKSAVRALAQPLPQQQQRSDESPPIEAPKKLGRKLKYSFECVEVLKKLYRAAEYVGSDKLKAMIPVLLKQRDLGLPDSVISELLEISPASIDRYLATYRSVERRRRNAGTRPGSLLFKKLVPLKSLTLVSPTCGYLAADTVAHCGGTMAGEFIWS